jgi:hypothetical protein
METPIPQEHPCHGKYPHAPHPYIIIPQLTGKRYFQSQDSLYFDMALIGKASEYLPYFYFKVHGTTYNRKETLTRFSVQSLGKKTRRLKSYQSGKIF